MELVTPVGGVIRKFVVRHCDMKPSAASQGGGSMRWEGRSAVLRGSSRVSLPRWAFTVLWDVGLAAGMDVFLALL